MRGDQAVRDAQAREPGMVCKNAPKSSAIIMGSTASTARLVDRTIDLQRLGAMPPRMDPYNPVVCRNRDHASRLHRATLASRRGLAIVALPLASGYGYDSVTVSRATCH
ncbi:hypothetical protein VOI32_07605 [Paraburkholderia caribensis]|uniref:Uncharacterized protein n=1 Tax=Paraburkholderia caribensis TaxID=75105 RepID=A0ABV0DVX7_9BURK|nr:hypothetical protein [Paraburkholderia caribensis]MCO4876297.1 hypothetical protein [Paraburkholderia caribensis]